MTTLHVVVDDHGSVVAAVRQTEATSGYGEGPGEIRLLPGPGQTLHTVVLADDSDDLFESLGTMSVHLDGGEPQLRPTVSRP